MTPRQEIMQRVRAICIRRDVCVKDVMGRSRFREHLQARDEVCHMLRFEYGLSFPAIGKFVGKDHSTVWFAIRRYQHRVEGVPLPKKVETMRKWRERRAA